MKRLLAFAVLLVVGFVILQQFLGDEALVTANTTGQKSDETQGDLGTKITTSGSGLGVSMEKFGEVHWPRVRLVPQPDGTSKKETVMIVDARDSRPVREGLQQLDDVAVTLHDRGAPIATVTAVQAFVELGRDGNGTPAIDESKDIDLRTVVVTGLAGTKLEGLRIALPRAKVHVEDSDLQIRTPSADDIVQIEFTGARSGTLVGKGLQARLPSDGGGDLQRIDIDLLSEPVLTTAGATLRAKGRLHYAEDTRSGTAEVSLQDDVELSLERANGVRVRGDQVLGWLLRAGTGRDAEIDWRLLQLSGAPATIDIGNLQVLSPQVTVLPGMDGQPFWIRAAGGESKFTVAKDSKHPDRPELHGASPSAIRVHVPTSGLAAAHRALGFPQWSLAPLDRMHVVTLEGNARIEDGERTVEATRGIDVHQLDEKGDAVVACGHGTVRVSQQKTKRFPAMAASGNDGFVLRRGRQHELAGAPWREHLLLGPPRDDDAGGAWRRHRYELSVGDLVATGVGASEFDREHDRTKVVLRAPDREIQARRTTGNGRVADVRELVAVLDGDDVVSFVLAGMPAHATVVSEDETFTADAPRIEQTSRASFVLLPPDPERAELWADLPAAAALPRLARDRLAAAGRGRERTATTAPRIDVLHVGHGRAVVDAQRVGDVPAHAAAELEGRTGEPATTIDLDADRIQLLPWALPPAVLGAHTAWLGGAAAALQSFTLGEPWLIGQGVQNALVVDGGNTFSGSAARFVLSAGAACGLLLGDAESLQPAVVRLDSEKRSATARGAQVRIRRGEEPMLEAFRVFPGRTATVLPEVELHEPGRSGPLAHLRAICNGDIGMWSDHVEFGGPVTLRAIAPDGATVAGGLTIVARELGMQLDPRRGGERQDLVRAIQARDVLVDWERCNARCATVQFDMERHLMLAADPKAAVVTLPNGLELSGRQITVDWQTLAYDIYRGRVAKRPVEASR